MRFSWHEITKQIKRLLREMTSPKLLAILRNIFVAKIAQPHKDNLHNSGLQTDDESR